MASVASSLSIVTRTCDRPEALARAAEGLRAQDVPFQWVIVNDGSTPVSKGLRNVGETVILLDPEERLGRAGAAKAGLDAATGDYLMLHDDDDALAPGALEVLCDYLDAHPDEVAVSCGYELWQEADSGDAALQNTVVLDLPPGLYDMAERNRLLTIGTLFRKADYQAIGGLRTDIEALEDWDLWLRLMLRGDIGMISAPLARQYVRPPETDGPAANSRHDAHHRAKIKLQNAYLRDDIEAGRIGLGALTHRPHARFVEEVDDRLRRAGQLKRKLLPWRRGDDM